jgi:hypothetical protein
MDISNFYGYTKYRNCVLDWLPMDTEELFNKNYQDKDKRLLLEKYNWNKNSIKYKFNNYGFRCEDFKDVDNIVFLGCSYTIGIGIPIDKSWTNIVGQKINLIPYNLGIGGASWDTIFRLAFYWLEKLKPKIVVVMETYKERLEWKGEDIYENILSNNPDWHNYGSWNVDKKGTFNKAFKKICYFDENFIIQKTKNKLAIEMITKNMKTKLLFITQFLKPDKIADHGKARDLTHPGVEINKEKAEEILQLL